MAKPKFTFNEETMSYEQITTSWRRNALKGLIYLGSLAALSIVFAILILRFFETPQDKIAKRRLVQMETEYKSLDKRVNKAVKLMDNLADRDENIYRVIFEAEPLSNEIRKSGFNLSKYKNLLSLPKGKLIRTTSAKVDQLEKQLAIQSKSYEDIKSLVENKKAMLASIPAIRPVIKNERNYLSSGFGFRFHPIYKTRKLHAGLDFSAPIGTNIVATGDGKVVMVKRSRRGYGKYIKINHDFGYTTLYAHMNKIHVKKGQKVKRGQVIGEVGNTGTSTAPHLHYEVHKNGKKINPIHYFFNDLTPEQYEEIIQRAEISNQSLD